MDICIEIVNCPSKQIKLDIYFFALMEWITQVSYTMFPWIKDTSTSHPQNIIHFIITILVVILSLISLVLIGIDSREVKQIHSLIIWAIICLIAMLVGPIGTGFFKSYFGIFERLGTLSVVIFNAILGIHLMQGKFLFNIIKKEE